MSVQPGCSSLWVTFSGTLDRNILCHNVQPKPNFPKKRRSYRAPPLSASHDQLIDLAKLVRTAQECQQQSDILRGLQDQQLAESIRTLQLQVQRLQNAVFCNERDTYCRQPTSGCGGGGPAVDAETVKVASRQDDAAAAEAAAAAAPASGGMAVAAAASVQKRESEAILPLALWKDELQIVISRVEALEAEVARAAKEVRQVEEVREQGQGGDCGVCDLSVFEAEAGTRRPSADTGGLVCGGGAAVPAFNAATVASRSGEDAREARDVEEREHRAGAGQADGTVKHAEAAVADGHRVGRDRDLGRPASTPNGAPEDGTQVAPAGGSGSVTTVVAESAAAGPAATTSGRSAATATARDANSAAHCPPGPGPGGGACTVGPGALQQGQQQHSSYNQDRQQQQQLQLPLFPAELQLAVERSARAAAEAVLEAWEARGAVRAEADTAHVRAIAAEVQLPLRGRWLFRGDSRVIMLNSFRRPETTASVSWLGRPVVGVKGWRALWRLHEAVRWRPGEEGTCRASRWCKGWQPCPPCIIIPCAAPAPMPRLADGAASVPQEQKPTPAQQPTQLQQLCRHQLPLTTPPSAPPPPAPPLHHHYQHQRRLPAAALPAQAVPTGWPTAQTFPGPPPSTGSHYNAAPLPVVSLAELSAPSCEAPAIPPLPAPPACPQPTLQPQPSQPVLSHVQLRQPVPETPAALIRTKAAASLEQRLATWGYDSGSSAVAGAAVGIANRDGDPMLLVNDTATALGAAATFQGVRMELPPLPMSLPPLLPQAAQELQPQLPAATAGPDGITVAAHLLAPQQVQFLAQTQALPQAESAIPGTKGALFCPEKHEPDADPHGMLRHNEPSAPERSRAPALATAVITSGAVSAVRGGGGGSSNLRPPSLQVAPAIQAPNGELSLLSQDDVLLSSPPVRRCTSQLSPHSDVAPARYRCTALGSMTRRGGGDAGTGGGGGKSRGGSGTAVATAARGLGAWRRGGLFDQDDGLSRWGWPSDEDVEEDKGIWGDEEREEEEEEKRRDAVARERAAAAAKRLISAQRRATDGASPLSGTHQGVKSERRATTTVAAAAARSSTSILSRAGIGMAAGTSASSAAAGRQGLTVGVGLARSASATRLGRGGGGASSASPRASQSARQLQQQPYHQHQFHNNGTAAASTSDVGHSRSGASAVPTSTAAATCKKATRISRASGPQPSGRASASFGFNGICTDDAAFGSGGRKGAAATPPLKRGGGARKVLNRPNPELDLFFSSCSSATESPRTSPWKRRCRRPGPSAGGADAATPIHALGRRTGGPAAAVASSPKGAAAPEDRRGSNGGGVGGSNRHQGPGSPLRQAAAVAAAAVMAGSRARLQLTRGSIASPTAR
ncbi:hypothetical protein VOLCADRAFT_86804 [Volvox carteri f. nagariensis]|uniref:Uncharacterized protein n=1 Tax=Volvox carteri f. nagariensis TaxID=3068 RepID=D8TJN0_VOLCA|nr:uncharacterized protein VOLCADRAFT_86804 [Volvox carteri f. nagariensis]EFJ52401.1 hypothetical protein VOLCADRAFT_86804 [Volvox carteri f. nagariensis]|eukprot:XP_002946474.1 hypothetical protein VOLCADRAFT_86804 [Volvox carteri f. nagariensis]